MHSLVLPPLCIWLNYSLIPPLWIWGVNDESCIDSFNLLRGYLTYKYLLMKYITMKYKLLAWENVFNLNISNLSFIKNKKTLLVTLIWAVFWIRRLLVALFKTMCSRREFCRQLWENGKRVLQKPEAIRAHWIRTKASKTRKEILK